MKNEIIKNRNTTKLISITFVLLLIVIGVFFSKNYQDESGELSTIFIKEKLYSSDAKIWGQRVITNVNGKFCIYDLEGNICKEFGEIQANWIDGLAEEGIVIYGNFANQTGIATFDSEENLIDNIIVLNTENLCIDPTIIKIGEIYYITLTEIVGNVNNADPNQENGQYTVKLYRSEDLRTLEYVTDIISEKSNLEDVDLIRDGDSLYIIYEMEMFDKMASSIMLCESTGDFTKWSEPIELLAADSDHEPANIEIKKNGEWKLYYSCDKQQPGQSYMGADIYCALISKNKKNIKEDILIPSNISGGKLLYDVQEIDGRRMYLYANDYLTNNDLVLEQER